MNAAPDLCCDKYRPACSGDCLLLVDLCTTTNGICLSDYEACIPVLNPRILQTFDQFLRTKGTHVPSSGLLRSPSLLLRNLVHYGTLSCSCKLESGMRFGHYRRLERIQQPEESSLGLCPKPRKWFCGVDCTASQVLSWDAMK